jgi:hypothetical protein
MTVAFGDLPGGAADPAALQMAPRRQRAAKALLPPSMP